MKIGIVGAGKVGTALGHVLKKKGFDVVAVASRRDVSLRTARRYIGEDCIYTPHIRQVVEMADIVAVTTQDREIKKVAEQVFMEEERLDGKIFFHTSGAHPSSQLSPLEKKGAVLGSLHPLQTFPDIDAGISVLPDTYIFIEGDQSALPALQTIASAAGFESVLIESENKVLYHLSAVFVCNLLSALLYSGEGIMKKIGIDLKPFYPIIKATLKNIENKGPLLSLTGPVVRGDAETIAAHIDAMEGMKLHEKVYMSLSLVALRMAEERKTLTSEQIEALRDLLKDDE
jgi:predicted short-subunit dehydrogenase-like oxidoreductase (DUF2520 family)